MSDGSEKAKNNTYFCVVVGDAMQFILSLQSANPSPTVVLESREPVGSVRKWIIAPPYCGGRLMIKIMKNML